MIYVSEAREDLVINQKEQGEPMFKNLFHRPLWRPLPLMRETIGHEKSPSFSRMKLGERFYKSKKEDRAVPSSHGSKGSQQVATSFARLPQPTATTLDPNPPPGANVWEVIRKWIGPFSIAARAIWWALSRLAWR